ncbi:MAG TPA: CzcE family metal-binding protein [Janthinobacterium sp.]|jgi:hypothetical protein|nr:CzcE family metal-binding protein [Janthinobacterium sp.]
MSRLSTKAVLLSSFLFSSALPAFDAGAIGPSGTSADYGSPAPANSAETVIALTPGTKWVRVDDGQTVQFTSGGKSFTWHFSTFKQPAIVHLSAIAPADLALQDIKVYVKTNPRYRYR